MFHISQAAVFVKHAETNPDGWMGGRGGSGSLGDQCDISDNAAAAAYNSFIEVVLKKELSRKVNLWFSQFVDGSRRRRRDATSSCRSDCLSPSEGHGGGRRRDGQVAACFQTLKRNLSALIQSCSDFG